MSLVDTTFLLSRNQLEEIFLSVYLLAFVQSRNARHQRIFSVVLNYLLILVQDAESLQTEIRLSHYALRCFVLFMAFLLQLIRCWI